MKNVAILSKSCKYFHAPFLADALNCKLYVIDSSQNECFPHSVEVNKFSINKKIKCDHLIIIGAMSLYYASKQILDKNYKSVTVIFCDTRCCRLVHWWKPFVKSNNIFVYAMPDLADYCEGIEWTPIYQTIEIPDTISIKMNEEPLEEKENIVISHSPGLKENYKGTDAIEMAINKLKEEYPIEYIKCNYLNWQDCLNVKLRSDIFIDQIVYKNAAIDQKRFGGKIPYNGAVGKSGLEAMLLNCCVVSGCRELSVLPYYEDVPVAYCDFESFYKVLERLIIDDELRDEIRIRQLQWSTKYLSKEFIVEHVTRHIR